MQKQNPDANPVPGQANEQDRGHEEKDPTIHTILGHDILNNDELERPPNDRSPLT